MSLQKLSHIFVTAEAIQDWRRFHGAVSRSPHADHLPPGLFLGEHHGHLLVIRSLRFDERTRDDGIRLGWLSAQFQLTADQGFFARAGLRYFWPPGDRGVLAPRVDEFRSYKEDLGRLPHRIVDSEYSEGIILTTTSSMGRSLVAVRAFVLSLGHAAVREVAVQTDPVGNVR